MAAEWFYLIDGKQIGPVEARELKELADDGMLQPTDLVWREGMPDWKPASHMKGLFAHPPSPPPVSRRGSQAGYYDDGDDWEYRQFVSKKIAAGLCGILLGPLGIHKFILGLNTAGVIMLCISLLTCGLGTIITSPIGLIEGIIYLTKSDDEFYENYALEKREWF